MSMRKQEKGKALSRTKISLGQCWSSRRSTIIGTIRLIEDCIFGVSGFGKFPQYCLLEIENSLINVSVTSYFRLKEKCVAYRHRYRYAHIFL